MDTLALLFGYFVLMIFSLILVVVLFIALVFLIEDVIHISFKHRVASIRLGSRMFGIGPGYYCYNWRVQMAENYEKGYNPRRVEDFKITSGYGFLYAFVPRRGWHNVR